VKQSIPSCPRIFNTKAQGIGLVDVILTVFIIGLVALYTIPTIMPSISHSTSLFRTKNFANNYLAAYFTALDSEDLAGSVPTYWEAAQRMKYTRILTSTTVITGGNACTTDVAGPPAIPCLLFADGSTAQFRADVDVNSTLRDHVIYDPDGTGPILPTTLVLDPLRGRVTTKGVATNTKTDDPAYTYEWTKM